MDKSFWHLIKILLAGMIFSWSVGCSSTWVREWSQPGLTELDYGHSVSHNKAEQIVNPPGGRSTGPPLGLAPQTGQTVYNTYNKSFERKDQEKPKPVIVDLSQ